MLLTAKQKLVFVMHRRQGIPQTEIAATLRITPESVCRLLARAEKRIERLAALCPGGDCPLLEAVAG